MPSRKGNKKPSKKPSKKLSCKKGQIKRVAYTKKSGVRVKAICIEDKGKPGKGTKIFTLTSNVLAPYGYEHVKDLTKEKRHTALNKAIKDMKPLSVFRRLIALSTLNKSDDSLYKLFREDADYVKSKMD